ncbi:hypothetical protein CY652_14870 [Burkholderia sp. WAC0059]|uniref:hypothetical protein n=1 Tax=Burkholderia sp. WAC0059 TaxID=2066022 RepID=UPI000C7F782D|nr:hypothetical protein [Burkholderia sp. WAC0059]PLZ01655.1 hypothetical protein CY652_14870 [Burkholderia sp. WAC0059]
MREAILVAFDKARFIERARHEARLLAERATSGFAYPASRAGMKPPAVGGYDRRTTLVRPGPGMKTFPCARAGRLESGF